jgi:hypothetical protein
MLKNRLQDPSEICALDFKEKLRRFKICSVSATIGTIGRFSAFFSRAFAISPIDKKTVTASLNHIATHLTRFSAPVLRSVRRFAWCDLDCR